jgi:hypothetical protein
LSTSRSIAALRVDSSSTWRTSAPTRVASPTAVAQISIGAARLVVPAQTASSTPIAWGRDSPVRIAASTLDRPRRDDAVDRHRLAGAHPQPIADRDRLDRHLADRAVGRDPARAPRGQRHSSSAAAAALRCERLTIHRDTSSRNVSIASESK